jgi:hypothetical protein
MDRREFLAKAGLIATWAAIPITITECGGSSSKPTQPNNGDIQGSVSVVNAHTHTVVITRAEITAGNGVTLTLTGSGHTHTVTLSSSDVGDIGQGTRVSHESSTDVAHSHQVTFN